MGSPEQLRRWPGLSTRFGVVLGFADLVEMETDKVTPKWDKLPSVLKRIGRGSSLRVGIVLAAAILIALGVPTSALAVTYQGTGSYDDGETVHPLAASVDFSTSGNQLIITLINTSTADVFVPSQILTGVFFNTGLDALNPLDAVVGPGSTVLFTDVQPVSLSGEWAYRSDVTEIPLGGDDGLGSSGLDGVFGTPDIIGEPNLSGPDSPDGLQYGITAAGDDPNTGNAKVTGSQELVQNSVVFTLSGLPDNYDPSVIGQVWFQYGTSLDQPGFPGGRPPGGGPPIPEPLTAMGVLLGVAGLTRYTRQRIRG